VCFDCDRDQRIKWRFEICGQVVLSNVKNTFIEPAPSKCGACGRVVVKALCYKPAGHGFNSQWSLQLIVSQ
jgi:hypothetical protein